jgi:hypothetical protein
MTRDISPLRFNIRVRVTASTWASICVLNLPKTSVDSRRRNRMQQAKTSRSFARLPQRIHKFSTASQVHAIKGLMLFRGLFAVDFSRFGASGGVQRPQEAPKGALDLSTVVRPTAGRGCNRKIIITAEFWPDVETGRSPADRLQSTNGRAPPKSWRPQCARRRAYRCESSPDAVHPCQIA